MTQTQNQNILARVTQIIDEQQVIINKSGVDFNLISILEMEHNERYAHSAFIAELLNPKGKHGMDDLYLKLFMETFKLEIEEFNTSRAEVLKELYVGERMGKRTFLDIVIRDKSSGKKILIENKIWAGDQENQLERYKEYNPDLLIYLTPDGKKYVNDIGEYVCLSYEDDIVKWLEACIEVTKQTHPKHALVIEMYLDTVKKITNQSIYHTMEQEIKEAILENHKNYEAAMRVRDSFNTLEAFITQKFNLKLEEKLKEKNYKTNGEFELDSLKIKYLIAFDYDERELFLGFALKESGKLSKDNVKALISAKTPKYRCNEGSSDSWPIWFNPLNVSTNLDNGLINDLMSSPDRIVSFYNNIEGEAESIAKYFAGILREIGV